MTDGRLITISFRLTEEEREALIKLSQSQRRHPREQGAILLRYALQRMGHIPVDGFTDDLFMPDAKEKP